ncbi:hypothetical protein JKP88DRAFT_350510 [Tribonema minus]|uniref:BHLH domain-containing protein n=1 Tax=Tribonema minus TaxID=303371 RepID=A0A835YLV5_9STRA|nr:hypothetical protein JKP88DRAFT_350510 [Tribonema minus]
MDSLSTEALSGLDEALLVLFDLEPPLHGGGSCVSSDGAPSLHAQGKDDSPALAGMPEPTAFLLPQLQQQLGGGGAPAVAAPKKPSTISSETYERKKGRAKMLRQEISDRFDDLQALLLEAGSSVDTTFIREKGAKRSSILDAAIAVIRSLSARVAACEPGGDAPSAAADGKDSAAPAPAPLQYGFAGSGLSLRLPLPPLGHASAGALAAAADQLAAAQSKQALPLPQQRVVSAAVTAPPTATAATPPAPAATPLLPAPPLLPLATAAPRRAAIAHLPLPPQQLSADSAAAAVFGASCALPIHAFLDAASLEAARRACRDWRARCAWDCTWARQCAARWRLRGQDRALEAWQARFSRVSNAQRLRRRDCAPETRAGALLRAGERCHAQLEQYYRDPEALAAPPVSWREVYCALHRELRLPDGALCVSAAAAAAAAAPHALGRGEDVIGRAAGGGACVWVALCRRSNGMTARSVVTPSGAMRAAEVVELRIVLQNIGVGARGTATAYLPRQPLRVATRGSSDGSSGGGSGGGGASSFFVEAIGDPRLSSQLVRKGGLGGRACGSGRWARWLDQPLRLYESATFRSAAGRSLGDEVRGQQVDQLLRLRKVAKRGAFLEVPGCATEAEFLDQAVSLDLGVELGGCDRNDGGAAAAARREGIVLHVGLRGTDAAATAAAASATAAAAGALEAAAPPARRKARV